MADNFYERGLKLLLDTQGVFNEPEIQVLRWLHSASQQSAATYWDNVTQRAPNDDLDMVIRNIKAKARHLGLDKNLEQIQEQCRSAEHA